MEREKDLADLIDSCISRLLEHSDAVQILITGTNPDGTCWSLPTGGGNWYARQGLAHEFITTEIAQENARQIDMILPIEEEDF